jgi:hypothetical protein
MSNQSVEGFIAEVNGTLEAIVLTCTALVATHPMKDQLLLLLNNLNENAKDVDNLSEVKKRYNQGIRNAVARIAQGVTTAKQAEQVRDLKADSGMH